MIACSGQLRGVDRQGLSTQPVRVITCMRPCTPFQGSALSGNCHLLLHAVARARVLSSGGMSEPWAALHGCSTVCAHCNALPLIRALQGEVLARVQMQRAARQVGWLKHHQHPGPQSRACACPWRS